MSAERPSYEVVRQEGSLELRRYSSYLTANVRIIADGYNEATYAAFNLLAGYIFGNNTEAGTIAMTAPVTSSRAPGTKIEMTAPVTSERVQDDSLEAAAPLCTVRCEGEYVVRFTMPSRFRSLAELPIPNDGRVFLDEVPEHLAVAARFSGRMDDSDVAAAVRQLDEWIKREGFVALGEPEAAQFDAPWKPGFVRHNEVLIPVQA